MKRWLKPIIALVLIIVVIAIVAVVTLKNGEKSALKVSSGDDLVKLVEEVYQKANIELPSLDTREVDLSDEMSVSSLTGLENGDKLEYLVASEPLINAQAFSVVIAKVKDGENSDQVAKTMFEKVDPRKWICVSAEKVCATSSGNVVFLVMTEKENTEKIYDAFKEIAESVGKEYSKDIEDGELPEDTVPGVFEIPEDTDTPVASVDEFGNVIENEVSNEVDNEVSNETEAPENTVNEVE